MDEGHVSLSSMRATILLPFLLLTACGGKADKAAESAAGNSEVAANTQPPAAAKPEAPAAKPFSVEEENDLYSFSYSWPAEAAAIPQLVEKFTKEMEEAKSGLIADARMDREGRAKEGFDYFRHEAQAHYETAGQSDRLLSLEYAGYAFTGGAHGSTGSGAFLWDRSAKRQVQIPDLLQPGASWTGAIRQPFCVLLDREREKRREEPVNKDDMFGNCPDYDELTVLLSDEDKSSRFDHIQVIADQYVAGPYAEGPYEISLPITAAMIERLKPEYRASFESRPPVK